MEIKKYRYKSKWILVFAIIIFSLVAVYIFYLKATNNSIGLLINGIIELSVIQATIFYWVFFIFSFIFLLAGIYIFYDNLNNIKHLELSENKIIIPAIGFKKNSTEIYYSDIIELFEYEISSNTFLRIQHSNGKINVNKAMLPNKKDYEQIKDFMFSKIEKTL